MTLMHNALLQLALPEVMVAIAALLALAVDVALLRQAAVRTRVAVAAVIGTAGCAAAIARIVLHPQTVDVLGGTLISNPVIHIVQTAILVVAALALWMAVDSAFTEYVGEYVLLMLLATVGMLFLVATQNLLVLFIALELLSLSLYAMAGFDRRSPRSAEAGLKYFLFGGMSAGFMLFGFSLLYGATNAITLPQIGAAVQADGMTPLLAIALVTTVIGFGFKVAAAPLHFWAPDVYEGAPLPSAAFIASASKIASFYIFYQVMTIALGGVAGTAWPHGGVAGWVPVLAIVAVVSMVLGNLVAIAQSSVRRLLAYSAVGHAGYMLLAIICHSQQSLGALIYYVITYALTTLGAFAVVGVVQEKTGGDSLADFEGLSRREPMLAGCLMIFLLSLAGIPPLAGFFGKFYLFVSVLAVAPRPLGLLWMVALAVAMSAVSLYYYLQVLKRAFVSVPAADAGPIQTPVLRKLLIVALAAAVVVLGCAPNLLLRCIVAACSTVGI